METPEELMKEGFESFFKARECFEKAKAVLILMNCYLILKGQND